MASIYHDDVREGFVRGWSVVKKEVLLYVNGFLNIQFSRWLCTGSTINLV